MAGGAVPKFTSDFDPARSRWIGPFAQLGGAILVEIKTEQGLTGYGMGGGRMWFTFGTQSLNFSNGQPSLANFIDPNFTLRYDWIEGLTGWDPDNHSGAVEWIVVAGLLAAAVTMGLVARHHWRLAAVPDR